MADLSKCDTFVPVQGSDLSYLERDCSLLKRPQEHNLVLTFGKCSFQCCLLSRGQMEGIRQALLVSKISTRPQ